MRISRFHHYWTIPLLLLIIGGGWWGFNQTSHLYLAANVTTSGETAVTLPKMRASIKLLTKGQGVSPLTVTFDGTGSLDPTGVTIPADNYEWYYYDNEGRVVSLGRGPFVTYVFTEPNRYVVRLKVSSVNGHQVEPAEATIFVTVKPQPGEVLIKINGEEVNKTVQVSQSAAQQGLEFDPTASTAPAGYELESWEWDFGDKNDNKIIHTTDTRTVSHVYRTSGKYRVTATATDNVGNKYPQAFIVEVIASVLKVKVTPASGTTDTEFTLDLGNETIANRAQKILWQITGPEGETSYAARKNKHKFRMPGVYKVTVVVTDNSGEPITETVTVRVDPKKPVVNFTAAPREAGTPNIMHVDATVSYDTDQGDKLKFNWWLDGQAVSLTNATDGYRAGELVIPNKGTHLIRLVVTDNYGNTVNVEKKVVVDSLFGVSLTTTPRVAYVGEPIQIAVVSKAVYVEMDYGDGQKDKSAPQVFTHEYRQAGVYLLKVKAYGANDEVIATQKKLYVGERNQPLASLQVFLGNNELTETALCGSTGFQVSRSDLVVFDASESVSRGGSTKNLTYHWDFGDGQSATSAKVKHPFKAAGNDECYPVTLTVQEADQTTGGQTVSVMIKVSNQLPTLKKLTAKQTKVLSPVRVDLTAEGGSDADGKIIKYNWYYYLNDPSERLGFHTTTKPTTQMPVLTEGQAGEDNTYYFVVELVDSDGAQISSEDLVGKTPLVIINSATDLPVINLNVEKVRVRVNEAVTFSAEATINGEDIPDGYYDWDFLGKGKYQEQSAGKQVNYVYDKAGIYQVKVRVKRYERSATATVTIYVDEVGGGLMAGFRQNMVGNLVIFQSTSRGTELRYAWDMDLSVDSDGNGHKDDDIDSILPDPVWSYPVITTTTTNRFAPSLSASGRSVQVKLTIEDATGAKDSLKRSFKLTKNTFEDYFKSYRDANKVVQAVFLSVPSAKKEDHLVHISELDNKVTFYPGKSVGEIVRYSIDQDLATDSDGDGDPANDADNRGTTSYTTGNTWSTYYLPTKSQIIARLTVYDVKGNQDAVDITILFDQIMSQLPETPIQPMTDEVETHLTKLTELIDSWPVEQKVQGLIDVQAVRQYKTSAAEAGVALDDLAVLAGTLPSGTDVTAVETELNALNTLFGRVVETSPVETAPSSSETVSNENNNINTGETPTTPAEPEQKSVFIGVVVSFLKFVLGAVIVVAGLLLLLYVIYLLYKARTKQALDFEEFILEFREKMGGLYERLKSAPPRLADPSPPTATEAEPVSSPAAPAAPVEVIETPAEVVTETAAAAPDWLKMDLPATAPAEEAAAPVTEETAVEETPPVSSAPPSWLDISASAPVSTETVPTEPAEPIPETPSTDWLAPATEMSPDASSTPDWLNMDAPVSASTESQPTLTDEPAATAFSDDQTTSLDEPAADAEETTRLSAEETPPESLAPVTPVPALTAVPLDPETELPPPPERPELPAPHRARPPRARAVPCKFCQGRGQDATGAPCSRCRGTGKYWPKKPKSSAPVASGEGSPV